MSSSTSLLSPTQRYAAGALFGLALHHAQIHQTRLLGFSSAHDDVSDSGERFSNTSSCESISDDPHLWIHESAGLLRPVFSCLEIDSMAWTGLEETAGLTPANHHIGAYLRLLSEESDDASPERRDKELALSNGIDAMARSMETSHSDIESKTEKSREYEHECRHKFSAEKQSNEEVANTNIDTKIAAPPDMITFEEVANTCVDTKLQVPHDMITFEEAKSQPGSLIDDKPSEEIRMLSDQKKLTVLYELLSACLADIPEDSKKPKKRRIGYDARYRVALRLLTTWFNVKWIKMYVNTDRYILGILTSQSITNITVELYPRVGEELREEAIENMVTCSAMAIAKEQQLKEEESKTPVSSWAKWKRGGIIGAAALTGGALMAVTGGLAAPAIAAGLGALAPTLGTIIPVIGASGFAAVASAAGGAVGSVAVAASFGAAGAGLTGSKMARRTGGIDEFEFKAIGENHNQGRLAVEILVSGFVFEAKDFILPWEGLHDNLERYALQWESKNLIAVSTAIQDWLTSRVALGLMKQGAMLTVLSSLVVALAWPATLIAATDFIDSKWAIAVDRSNKAGKLLAEVLVKGLQGQRPVTLVGFSLGARVIYKCLQELAETGHNAEIVERVVLLGAPISIKGENWEAARKVVAGRFVNAYTTNDWMLGVAFRASLLSQGLAGIQPIDVPGIENVDVTEFVDGHSSYLWASQQILEKLEIETYYPVFGNTLFKP